MVVKAVAAMWVAGAGRMHGKCALLVCDSSRVCGGQHVKWGSVNKRCPPLR